MKTTTRKITLVFFLYWSTINFYAQDIRIKQGDLPYAIPIIESPTHGDMVEYKWLENDKDIAGANDYIFIIPQEKEIGFYTYIHQVKCIDCSEWLSSNAFTVEIFTEEEPVSDLNDAIRVKFSPQKELTGYLEELVQLIDQTKVQLDISIYSIDNEDVYLALRRAIARGVQIRMLYEGAIKDRSQSTATLSHYLEDMGVDVKYVNKTNHNKFIISDQRFLITSSGNWNSKANWKYEDSSLLVTNEAILIQYRAEFELLWNNSREFGKKYFYTVVNPDSLLLTVAYSPDIEVLFTSSNYRISNSATHGPTFSKTGNRQLIADKIVQLINNSQKSIKIAANYLRSRPICDALIAKKKENPNLIINVLTDQNEFITQSFNDYQLIQREECLSNASTAAKVRDCLEKNFLYSYELIEAGISVRFKTYSYKWHYTTAHVMHHKYAIFDDDVVAMGSYNYSYNSETNCMENLLVFNKKAASRAVEKYVLNFNDIWELGRGENYYNDLLQLIDQGARYIPLVYHSVALSHSEYAYLKERIERACPAVKHDYFKKNGQFYLSYLKGVLLKYNYGNTLITEMEEYFDQHFTLNYDYDSNDDLTGIRFQSYDSLNYNKKYKYDNNKKLIQVNTPVFNVDFTYYNNQINTVDSGLGKHNWMYQSQENDEIKISYNAPFQSHYLETIWTGFRIPKRQTDLENRSIEWIHDNNGDLNSISSSNRTINFTNANASFLAYTSDGYRFKKQLYSLFKYIVSTKGIVNSTVSYHTQRKTESEFLQSIDIFSDNVTSGKGRVANINYEYDAYNRTIKAGDLKITRKPYSGEITEITNGKIVESRTYNLWSLLTDQIVKHGTKVLYKVHYEYDGLHRIKSMNEDVLGVSTIINYRYNAKGQIEQVIKNGIITEEYQYDDFGNRTLIEGKAQGYLYANNNQNQTVNLMAVDSDNLKEFKYNKAGQLMNIIHKTSNSITSEIHFDYDVFGNLNTVILDDKKLEYHYDAFERQIALFEGEKQIRKFIYGIGDLPLAELDEEDRISSTYIYADKAVPLLLRKESIPYYIISDIRGSVRLIIDVYSGKVLQQIEYDTFGRVLVDTNPGYSPFGFAGGLYDYRTDLVRFGMRDYLVEIGKWTTENPVGFLSGGFNDYSFLCNDPINFVSSLAIKEQYVNSELGKKEFDLNRIYKNMIGVAAKGQSWFHFGNRYPVNIFNLESPTLRNINNRIYPTNGNKSIHNKVNAFNNWNSSFYRFSDMSEWGWY